MLPVSLPPDLVKVSVVVGVPFVSVKGRDSVVVAGIVAVGVETGVTEALIESSSERLSESVTFSGSVSDMENSSLTDRLGLLGLRVA